MLDSTTTALRAALLVSKGYANANGYGNSIGSLSKQVAMKSKNVTYAMLSIGTLKPISMEKIALATAGKLSDVHQDGSTTLIEQPATSPNTNGGINDTGEPIASVTANKTALENATGSGQNSTQVTEAIMAPTPPTDSIIGEGSHNQSSTQQQAQLSFFEKNKKTILVAAVLLVAVAVFFWKK